MLRQPLLRKPKPKERSLKRLTIYIVRVNNFGKMMMSRPCPDCMETIYEAGIREIVFSNEFGGISVERLM